MPPEPSWARRKTTATTPSYDCFVGIDPGTHTGVAVTDHRAGLPLELFTLDFWKTIDLLCSLHEQHQARLLVVIEDPTQKKTMFARYDKDKAKGPAYYARIAQSVGENMAQAKLLLAYCLLRGIATEAVSPLGKIESEAFAALTGITSGSQHARDAARLIMNR